MSAPEWATPEVLDLREIAIDFQRKEGRSFSPSTMTSCHGDLRLICDVLVDYARLCDERRAQGDMTALEAGTYEYYADRCRRIAEKFAAAIGYDREATIRRCMKNREKAGDDVGEDALVLATRYRGGKRVDVPLGSKSPDTDREGGEEDGEV